MQIRPQRLFDYREFPVLYVDDEPENLRIFELGFRREFEVLTANSGEEGLQILAERQVAVVLSDHKMPGMTGVEFLSRVRELDPKTIRMLVTAYGDVETLTGAINDGSIYRYLAKPWHPDELRISVKRAIEVFALDRERDELLRELTTLNRVTQTINQELALDPLVGLLLECLVTDLSFDGAAVLLFDDRKKCLQIARSLPLGPVSDRLRGLELGASGAGGFVERLQGGETQVLEMEKADSYPASLREWITEVAADQILVAPLVDKQEVIGAVAVDNRRGGAAFEAAERLMLGGFATQAAIALANAQLVEALRRSKQHIERADRLKTVGTLAAGIAHEINNPLVSVQTFLTLAPEKRSEPDDEFWGEYHDLTVSELDRIRRLVATMSRLAHGGEDDVPKSPCSLGSIAEEAVRLVTHEAQEGEIDVRLEIDLDTPKILGVRDQIHQVVLNLLLNAIHSTPPGGQVCVRTWGDGDAALLEVRDTGRGIREDDLEQIFDPFFTTKGPDKGTGLGLMICHRIVLDHEGSIEVESSRGQGATFRVRLPAAEDPASQTPG
ncbi:MAG: ATP-binding protein [Myxococcales bacterium]|nr:ATP-binding protein [Myxococcales bacterium]